MKNLLNSLGITITIMGAFCTGKAWQNVHLQQQQSMHLDGKSTVVKQVATESKSKSNQEQSIKQKYQKIDQEITSLVPYTYKTLYDKYSDEAKVGKVEAMYALAIMYRHGTGGVKHNREQAKIWYQRAAEKQNPAAMFNLGVLTEEDAATDEIKISHAMYWYLRAAKRGNPNAMCALGRIYDTGKGDIAQNSKEAIFWYGKAVRDEIPEALTKVAEYCRQDKSNLKQLQEAYSLHSKAAMKGSIPSMFHLGVMNLDGEGRVKNIEEAKKWFTLAADKGSIAAMFALGNLYKSISSPQSLPFAFKWYHEAALQNHIDACYALGSMYEIGKGVKANYTKAAKWYKKAAKKNHLPATMRLALFYQKGYGVKKNPITCAKLYRKAALLGNVEAMNKIGRIYTYGEYSISQNHTKGIKWLTQASQQGCQESSYELGWIFHRGKIVPKNIRQAIRWYTLAVEHGNIQAMLHLGNIYRYAAEVKNIKKAIHFYQKAAQAENPVAMYNLAQIYSGEEENTALLKNLHQAKFWYKKLLAQGNHTTAMYSLAKVYEQEHDIQASIHWHFKAASAGLYKSVTAIEKIISYHKEDILGKDYYAMRLVGWYQDQLIKSQGKQRGQISRTLGKIFAQGLYHQDKNYSKAIAYYLDGAKHSSDNYQQVALLYYQGGHGIKSNPTQAIKFFKKFLLCNPSKKAKGQTYRILGNLYYKGKGVKQDPIKASHWYQRAAKLGENVSPTFLNHLSSLSESK